MQRLQNYRTSPRHGWSAVKGVAVSYCWAMACSAVPFFQSVKNGDPDGEDFGSCAVECVDLVKLGVRFVEHSEFGVSGSGFEAAWIWSVEGRGIACSDATWYTGMQFNPKSNEKQNCPAEGSR